MKIRLLIIVFSLIIGNQVFARVIQVRSGEHNTFSRIVLNIPVGTNWNLTQSGRLAELSLELPDIQFDTSQVFDRIPRNRLLGLSQRQSGEALQMNIGCECKVVGFILAAKLLVIDIQDPEKPISPPPRAFYAAPTLRFSNVSIMESHGPKMSWNLEPEIPRKNAESAALDELEKTATISLLDQGAIENVNASELRLLSQIDRATAQGLLLRNVHISMLDAPPAAVQVGGGDYPRHSNKIDVPRQTSMTAVTSMDRELAKSSWPELQGEDQNSCLPADLVALPEWGNTLPFGTQIGNRRSNLFGEFDDVNQQSVIELTRNLLFFGFGAEAKISLSLLEGEELTNQVLSALAEILDNGNTLTRNPFLNQKRCNSDVALWAYLADPNGSAPEHPNTEAVLTAFARLPDHLRVLLGPNLIRKFSNLQDFQSVDIVSRTANRTLNKSDPALDLARANADIQYKNPDDAVSEMKLLAQSGTEYSPQALIDLINAQTLSDKTISPDIPDLISTYKSEYRKSDLAANLHRAHVLSLALTERFPEAFKNYHEQNEGDRKSDENETLEHVMVLLAKRANDITFLRYALDQIERPGSDFSVSLQNLLAARLIDLGFSEQASVLLTDRGGEENGDRQLMNAQIAISENLPHRALVELLGSNDPLAEALRTQAFLDIGDYENAGLSREADGVDAGRAFWHADNWKAVNQQTESQFSEAAVLAESLGSTNQDTGNQDSLFYAQSLTVSSSATRSDISALLGLVGQKP